MEKTGTNYNTEKTPKSKTNAIQIQPKTLDLNFKNLDNDDNLNQQTDE